MNKSFFLILIIMASLSSLYSQNNARYTESINQNWLFMEGDFEGAHQSNFKDSEWRTLSIPHDWAIEKGFEINGDGNTGKLPWKGQAWYRKELYMRPTEIGKTHYLLFDGIMAFPSVYVNGQLAGKWDYGYNSFYLDVSDYLKEGINQLAIHVDTRQHDSRWYPGAGIFRKIQLIRVHPLHIGIWGTHIQTPIIKANYADISIRTELINKTAEDQLVEIHHQLYSPTEILIDEIKDSIFHNSNIKYHDINGTISNPELWDIESPSLYRIKTILIQNGEIIDEYSSTFGIRKIRFSADYGFHLNDRRIQLKGVNLHHDHGALGAAFNKRAMERQLEIMQDIGCNAVRSSHNVPAPELLELCDSMGILVFNEIFDKYDGKAGISDTTDFDDFAHRNISNFIRRDRNHPSIFLWSVGNEIGDVQWNINGGFQKLKTMVNYVRKYDMTRPVTLVCDSEKSASLRHFDYYDVHNWNYGRRYKLARQLEPNKSVIISESASTLSTRGFYEFPLPEKKTDFTTSLQVSSYDLNAPWWAEVADDDFMWQQEEEYIAGEFVWTGFDYLGEPTPYNNDWMEENGFSDSDASRSSYFGIVDLCGIPKDRYYLYKSYWKQDENTIHILPHWNWPDKIGENVPVFVYTNGDAAELFLNGVSQGWRNKKPKSLNSTERFRLMWKDIKYEPGEIKVIAYKNKEKIGEKLLKTTGEANKLMLKADRKEINADGQDISYILVEALDRNDISHPLASNLLEIEVSGPGFIAGVCNGNPQSMEAMKGNEVSLFYGKAMLLIQSTKEKGEIRVQVKSDGLKSAQSIIQSK